MNYHTLAAESEKETPTVPSPGENVVTTRFIEQDFECPCCKNIWRDRVVEAVTHQGQDSDFYPHYIGDDPLPFFIVQCPRCLYAGYPDDFNLEPGIKTRITVTIVRDVSEQPLAKKLPREAAKYYVAAKLYEMQKRNSYHIGNLYLRGSWCCRKEGNRRAEIEMQQLAVKFLRQAIDQSSLINPDSLPVVTYLIGELYRRLEDKTLAREWFGSVEEVIYDNEQQWLLELTKKQAELNEHFIN
jgi:uncharacterized protein (DUF2225 family)